jgi:hypothetical protein
VAPADGDGDAVAPALADVDGATLAEADAAAVAAARTIPSPRRALGDAEGDAPELAPGDVLAPGDAEGDGAGDGVAVATQGGLLFVVLVEDDAMKKSAIDVAVATWSAWVLRMASATWHCQLTLPGMPPWLYGPATCPSTKMSISLE